MACPKALREGSAVGSPGSLAGRPGQERLRYRGRSCANKGWPGTASPASFANTHNVVCVPGGLQGLSSAGHEIK
jgi:hypothetical protein